MNKKELLTEVLTKAFSEWETNGFPFKTCAKWDVICKLTDSGRRPTVVEETVATRFVVQILFDHFQMVIDGNKVYGVTAPILEYMVDMSERDVAQALLDAIRLSKEV